MLKLFLIIMLLAAPDDPPVRKIAITFDDLPSVRLRDNNKVLADMTAKLLDHLDNHQVPAVGFVNEGKLYINRELDQGRVDLLRMWCEAGYELGNHTFSHMDLHRTTIEKFQKDIIKGEEITRPLLSEYNLTLRYFRHPLLHTGRDLEIKHNIENFLSERGYQIAPVTIDNSEWIYAKAYFDARKADDDSLMNRIAESYLEYMIAKIKYFEDQSTRLFDREIPQILLLHANYINADHFGQLAELIRARGYDFVTLEDVLVDDAFDSPDTYTGPGGITWIHRWAISVNMPREFYGEEPEAPKWILDSAGVEYE